MADGELPVAVLSEEVFVHLDVADVVACSQVCQDWLEASRSPGLWRRLHRIQYGGGSDPGAATVEDLAVDWQRAAALAHQITTRAGAVSLGMTGASVQHRSGATAAVLPPAFEATDPGAAGAGNCVVVLGGNSDGYALRPSADLLDIGTGRTTAVDVPVFADGAPPRYSSEVLGSWLQGCAVTAGRLFLFGGEGSNALWELSALQTTRRPRADVQPAENGAKFVRLGPPVAASSPARWPPGRVGHTLVSKGGCLLCFGGRHTCTATQEKRLLNDLWRYDVAEGSWTELTPSGPAPPPRWCHSAAMLDVPDRMVIFGGWKYPDSVFMNDLFIFEVAANRYVRVETAGPLPSPRCQCTLFRLPRMQSMLVLFGGASHKDEQGFRNTAEAYGTVVVDLCDIWVLDLAAATWLRCAGAGQPVLRGGVNTHVRIHEGGPAETVLMIGGMHSDAGVHMPTFVGDVAALSVDLMSPGGDADGIVVVPPHWRELGDNVCHYPQCKAQ